MPSTAESLVSLRSMSRHRCNTALTASKIYEDEAIVINTATGRYYDLEGAGAELWSLLDHGITVDEAATALTATFDVDTERARADVAAFFERLVAEELVVTTDDGVAPGAPSEPSESRRPYTPPSLTTFTDMEERPERLFTDNGYAMVALESVPKYAVERADIGIPKFLINYVLGTLRNGYVIAVFRR